MIKIYAIVAEIWCDRL